MATWEEWAQDIGGTVIKSAADAEFNQPYQLQKMQLTAYGENGYYTEGQRGYVMQNGQLVQAGGSNTTLWLLLGGVGLVAVLLLRK